MEKSTFTGGIFALIGHNLGLFFGTLFTLGIAGPWLRCWKCRWLAKNTFLNGKKVAFDGTGGKLWGMIFRWMFLSIITVGIYALWIPVKYRKWITGHIFVLPQEPQTIARYYCATPFTQYGLMPY